MTSLEGRTEAAGSSDNELIVRAQQGDAAAFAALYDRFADRVYRHVVYRIGNRHDAEDLTQQTLINAWRAIGRYRITEVPFFAWLVTIAQNLVATYARRNRGREFEPLEPDPPFFDPDPEPPELAERSFTQETVRRAVAELPNEQQQVVVMRYLDGLDYSVVARALGKTENNVRVIAHRALKRLQGLLREDGS
jgi:RNA polymerase sigma-70 factor (ECF subfamily)